MRSFLVRWLFFTSQLYSVNAYSDDAYEVIAAEDKIYINDHDYSEIILENLATGTKKTCKIINWTEKDTKNGGGLFRITTDKKAIIFFSSHRYLLIDELRTCNQGTIQFFSLPNSNITMLQDINFSHKLFLQFSLEDKNRWLASISHFGSNINLLNGEGFYNPINKKKKEGFSLGNGNGDGKISINGQYVVANEINCEEGEIPIGFGLWDINSNKRVTFPTKIDEFGRVRNSEEVYEKCTQVFEGKYTIQQLGGKLTF